MKKWWKTILAGILCLCLSGCSFPGLDAKNLMSPPRADGDQESIHQLLQGDNPSVTFVYPKNGEYRSAVIMQDFTGDGKQDAIGFQALDDRGVEVRFLIKGTNSASPEEGESWRTAAFFQNSALQVDRVCFGDINGDGVTDVLIGWGSTSGITGRTASVNAYLYQDGDVTEHVLGTYGEMVLTDFDGDGVSEVFTIDKFLPAQEEGAEPSPAQAKLYAFRGGAVTVWAQAAADNSISSYVSLAWGRVSRQKRGVVVDGAKADGSMTTQIFTLGENGGLENWPKGVNEEGYVNPYARSSGAAFLTKDANGDGILDMPVATLLPGISQDVEPDATSYLVTWTSFSETGKSRGVLRTLVNSAENYWFRVPYQFLGEISASNDPEKRTVTYMQAVPSADGGEMLLGQPLFSIRAFSLSAWESRGTTSGYEPLLSQSDTVYGIQIFTRDEAVLRGVEQVKEEFRLISGRADSAGASSADAISKRK